MISASVPRLLSTFLLLITFITSVATLRSNVTHTHQDLSSQRHAISPQPGKIVARQDYEEDEDEDDAEGGATEEPTGVRQAGAIFTALNQAIAPQIFRTFSQIHGAVNLGLNGTLGSPNIPTFLRTHGPTFLMKHGSTLLNRIVSSQQPQAVEASAVAGSGQQVVPYLNQATDQKPSPPTVIPVQRVPDDIPAWIQTTPVSFQHPVVSQQVNIELPVGIPVKRVNPHPPAVPAQRIPEHIPAWIPTTPLSFERPYVPGLDHGEKIVITTKLPAVAQVDENPSTEQPRPHEDTEVVTSKPPLRLPLRPVELSSTVSSTPHFSEVSTPKTSLWTIYTGMRNGTQSYAEGPLLEDDSPFVSPPTYDLNLESTNDLPANMSLWQMYKFASDIMHHFYPTMELPEILAQHTQNQTEVIRPPKKKPDHVDTPASTKKKLPNFPPGKPAFWMNMYYPSGL